MAERHSDYLSLVNAAPYSLPGHRRVKLCGRNTNGVVLADMADANHWLGVTIPVQGGDTPPATRATVQLRAQNRTFKLDVYGAVPAGAAIYPFNSGMGWAEVGDTIIGHNVGDAIVGNAGGGTIEFLPVPVSGPILSPDNVSLDSTGASPLIVVTMGNHGGGRRPYRDLRIVRAYVRQKHTVAFDFTLLSGRDWWGRTAISQTTTIGATQWAVTSVPVSQPVLLKEFELYQQVTGNAGSLMFDLTLECLPL